MKHIESLDDDFRDEIEKLLQAAEDATGYQWVVTSGRRTMEQQSVLYQQGRTLPGKVVTNARPGQSAHNFGLAADLAPMRNGKIWWDAPRDVWKEMADIAVGMGLVSGYYFKTIFDAPHVESKDWREVRAEWQAGKIKLA